MKITFEIPDAAVDELVNAVSLKCFSKTVLPPQPEQADLVNIDEACRITGYKKPTLYHKSFTGEVPVSRLGKFLVFSRRELNAWRDGKTIRKQSAESLASEHLQAEAKKH